MISTLLAALCYLVGSIPFGLLVAQAKGVDIRQVGSGNIGATNVSRALGKPWGLLVFGLDFFKGFAPTLAAQLLSPRLGTDPFTQFDMPVLCGLSAVLGHVFPVWLGFRGGKAGATGLGVGTVICWQAMVAAGLVWLIVVGISRYVSLGTILASIAYVAAYFATEVFLRNANPFDRARFFRFFLHCRGGLGNLSTQGQYQATSNGDRESSVGPRVGGRTTYFAAFVAAIGLACVVLLILKIASLMVVF